MMSDSELHQVLFQNDLFENNSLIHFFKKIIPSQYLRLIISRRTRVPLFQHLQSNLSTTATLPGDKTKKVVIVERWSLWGGRDEL